jgi:hypothetical protein
VTATAPSALDRCPFSHHAVSSSQFSIWAFFVCLSRPSGFGHRGGGTEGVLLANIIEVGSLCVKQLIRLERKG